MEKLQRSDDGMVPKVALITGITGQDGSYLSELLLERGYVVHGIIRRSSSLNTQRIQHIYGHPRLFLHYGDLTDSSNITQLMSEIRPDEVYNLGAMSHVKVSFDLPEYTADVDGTGVLRLINAIRACGLEKKTKVCQASTSELYGKVQEIPQTETTPFYPRSPYATAKLFAFWTVKNYREAYNMFICNALNFNHESPRRGPTFVTRKVTRAVARIKKGLQQTLYLGNLEAMRDWGHAKDFIRGMWMILQQDTPDDYVLATGETHSVREFAEKAFRHAGIEIEWRGQRGSNEEEGYDKANPDHALVNIDPKYFRPSEVDLLLGDASKAKKILGWEPEVSFDELVKEMVEADIALVEKGDLTS